MLAVCRRLQAFDDSGNLFQVGKIERHVGADRKTNAVRGQGYPADQIENCQPLRFTTNDAVVYGDLKHVEMIEVLARPIIDGRAVSNADREAWLGISHSSDLIRRMCSLPTPSLVSVK